MVCACVLKPLEGEDPMTATSLLIHAGFASGLARAMLTGLALT